MGLLERFDEMAEELAALKETVETNKKLQNRTCVSLSLTDKELYKCQETVDRHEESIEKIFKDTEKRIFEIREMLEERFDKIESKCNEIEQVIIFNDTETRKVVGSFPDIIRLTSEKTDLELADLSRDLGHTKRLMELYKKKMDLEEKRLDAAIEMTKAVGKEVFKISL